MKTKAPFEPSDATVAQTMTPTGFKQQKMVRIAGSMLDGPSVKMLTLWECLWGSGMNMSSLDQQNALLPALLISSNVFWILCSRFSLDAAEIRCRRCILYDIKPKPSFMILLAVLG